MQYIIQRILYYIIHEIIYYSKAALSWAKTIYYKYVAVRTIANTTALGRANPAARGIAQSSFYNFTLFPTLTFERSCWADI